MAVKHLSSKRLQISKANLYIVIVISVACFVSIFALTASKALFSQRNYQARVIAQKEQTKTQLQANLKTRDQLVATYKSFVNRDINIIGGTRDGTTDRDGDDAKIVLDALPSKYDYPALASSLERLMTLNGLTIANISGTDDEVNQSVAGVSQSPVPIEVPFTIDFSGTQENTKNFLQSLNRSIRPIQVQKISVSGNDEKLTTNIVAKTYYQPEKALTLKNEVVK